MKGKILITGANWGIGFEISKQMALKNYYVILGVRRISEGQKAIKKLLDNGISKSLLDLIQIDLNNNDSIKKANNYIKNNHSNLDTLINNAGIAGDISKPALNHCF